MLQHFEICSCAGREFRPKRGPIWVTHTLPTSGQSFTYADLMLAKFGPHRQQVGRLQRLVRESLNRFSRESLSRVHVKRFRSIFPETSAAESSYLSRV